MRKSHFAGWPPPDTDRPASLRKKLLLAIAVIVLLAWPFALARATTVTGNIKVLSGSTNIARMVLSVGLEGCSAGPVVPGSLLLTTPQEIPVDQPTGSFNYSVPRSDTEVNCSGVYSSNYLFTITVDRRVVWQKRFKFVDAAAELSTYPSYSDLPAQALPNYAVRNGGNVFIGAQDFNAATITGVDEDHSINIENPTVLDSGKFQKRIARAGKLQAATCDVEGSGTVTLTLEIRSVPNSSGIAALSAPMVCTSTGVFPPPVVSSGSIAAGSYVVPTDFVVSGVVTLVRVHFNTK